MTYAQNRQPQGTSSGGQFAGATHAEPAVSLDSDIQHLEAAGNQSAIAVHEALAGASTAEDDGAGIYLRLELNDSEDFVAGCPTLAAENINAKWYCSTSGGDFHIEHPEFDRNADPEAVAAWILETRNGQAAKK